LGVLISVAVPQTSDTGKVSHAVLFRPLADLGAFGHEAGRLACSLQILMENLVIFTRGTNPTVPLVKIPRRNTFITLRQAI
jgi:hypothetical protein